MYELRPAGATMQLLNADGSASELSGNGLRCLAALVARAQTWPRVHRSWSIPTPVRRRLELMQREGERYTFRAAMGAPEELRQESIPVAGESIRASVLRIGNPQCIVLGPLPDAERFHRIGPLLSTHAMFPAGTNVEFAHVEAPDRVQDSDLGAWRRTDDLVGNRLVGVSGRRGRARRRGSSAWTSSRPVARSASSGAMTASI